MIEIFFWILLLLWFVGGFVPEEQAYYRYGRSIILFVLFVLIGLTIYHNPLR